MVYDCMDELVGLSRSRRPSCASASARCCERADLVFTGGHSLYEAKRAPARQRPRLSQSSVDAEHFASARDGRRRARRPGAHRRAAARLLRRDRRAHGPGAARARSPTRGPTGSSSWSARWSRSTRRRCRARPTSTTSAARAYAELPAYLAGWDVALMPFAHQRVDALHQPDQDAGIPRGGRPVVSTPIRDVVRHYGDSRAWCIADDARRSSPPAIEGAGIDRAAASLAAEGRRAAGRARPGTRPGRRMARAGR